MRRHLSFFVLGFITFLLISELILRGVGHFAKREASVSLPGAYQKKILCLGNSFTEGRGAIPSMSYPAQLERLLKIKFPSENYQVVNLGSSGLNTHQTIEQVKKLNEEFSKANLVIVQVGQPNWWNYLGYGEYLEHQGKNAAFVFRFYSLFNHSHLFRFLTRLWAPYDEMSNKTCLDNSKEDLQSVLKQVAWFRGQEEKVTPDVLKRAQLQEKIFQDKNVLNPSGPSFALLAYLSFFFFKDEQKTLNYLKEGILKTSCAPSNLDFNPYAMFKRLEPLMRNQTIKKEMHDFYLELNVKYPIKSEWLEGNDSSIAAWTKSELKELVTLLKKYPGKIILQNYPPLPKGFYSEDINRILREVAKEESLPFLDNEKIFAEMWSQGKRREDYHAPDEHLNEKGYGVQAQKLLELIKNL